MSFLGENGGTTRVREMFLRAVSTCWRGTLGMEPIIPAGDALDAAVQEIRRAEPTFGFRRVIGVLKDKRPDWQVSEKRVRKCFERTAATSLAAEPDGSDRLTHIFKGAPARWRHACV